VPFALGVQERYPTACLNRLGDRVWSQTYTGWDQVCLPAPTLPIRTQPAFDFFSLTSNLTFCFASNAAPMISECARNPVRDPHTAFQTHDELDLPNLCGNLSILFLYDSYPMQGK